MTFWLVYMACGLITSVVAIKTGIAQREWSAMDSGIPIIVVFACWWILAFLGMLWLIGAVVQKGVVAIADAIPNFKMKGGEDS
jgi:hypothetical protein